MQFKQTRGQKSVGMQFDSTIAAQTPIRNSHIFSKIVFFQQPRLQSALLKKITLAVVVRKTSSERPCLKFHSINDLQNYTHNKITQSWLAKAVLIALFDHKSHTLNWLHIDFGAKRIPWFLPKFLTVITSRFHPRAILSMRKFCHAKQILKK